MTYTVMFCYNVYPITRLLICGRYYRVFCRGTSQIHWRPVEQSSRASVHKSSIGGIQKFLEVNAMPEKRRRAPSQNRWKITHFD